MPSARSKRRRIGPKIHTEFLFHSFDSHCSTCKINLHTIFDCTFKVSIHRNIQFTLNQQHIAVGYTPFNFYANLPILFKHVVIIFYPSECMTGSSVRLPNPFFLSLMLIWLQSTNIHIIIIRIYTISYLYLTIYLCYFALIGKL